LKGCETQNGGKSVCCSVRAPYFKPEWRRDGEYDADER
jgi:hypothetical protein